MSVNDKGGKNKLCLVQKFTSLCARKQTISLLSLSNLQFLCFTVDQNCLDPEERNDFVTLALEGALDGSSPVRAVPDS